MLDHALQELGITSFRLVDTEIESLNASNEVALYLAHRRIVPNTAKTIDSRTWTLYVPLQHKTFAGRDRSFDYLEWHDTQWMAFRVDIKGKWNVIYDGPVVLTSVAPE